MKLSFYARCNTGALCSLNIFYQSVQYFLSWVISADRWLICGWKEQFSSQILAFLCVCQSVTGIQLLTFGLKVNSFYTILSYLCLNQLIFIYLLRCSSKRRSTTLAIFSFLLNISFDFLLIVGWKVYSLVYFSAINLRFYFFWRITASRRVQSGLRSYFYLFRRVLEANWALQVGCLFSYYCYFSRNYCSFWSCVLLLTQKSSCSLSKMFYYPQTKLQLICGLKVHYSRTAYSYLNFISDLSRSLYLVSLINFSHFSFLDTSCDHSLGQTSNGRVCISGAKLYCSQLLNRCCLHVFLVLVVIVVLGLFLNAIAE